MTAEEEMIIGIGLAIVKDVYGDRVDIATTKATPSEISLYAYGPDGCYNHNGWHFSVQKEKTYGSTEIFCVNLLDDGTPVYSISLLDDVFDRPIHRYIIYTKGKYHFVSEEKYYAYNNFDLSKGFTIEMFDIIPSRNKKKRRN